MKAARKIKNRPRDSYAPRSMEDSMHQNIELLKLSLFYKLHKLVYFGHNKPTHHSCSFLIFLVVHTKAFINLKESFLCSG